MGDAPAEPRALGELLVHVHTREVAGDPGEEVDVALADGLPHGFRVTERNGSKGRPPVARHLTSRGRQRPTRRRRRSSAR